MSDPNNMTIMSYQNNMTIIGIVQETGELRRFQIASTEVVMSAGSLSAEASRLRVTIPVNETTWVVSDPIGYVVVFVLEALKVKAMVSQRRDGWWSFASAEERSTEVQSDLEWRPPSGCNILVRGCVHAQRGKLYSVHVAIHKAGSLWVPAIPNLSSDGGLLCAAQSIKDRANGGFILPAKSASEAISASMQAIETGIFNKDWAKYDQAYKEFSSYSRAEDGTMTQQHAANHRFEFLSGISGGKAWGIST